MQLSSVLCLQCGLPLYDHFSLISSYEHTLWFRTHRAVSGMSHNK
jgi:hypothetical protein